MDADGDITVLRVLAVLVLCGLGALLALAFLL